MVFVFHRAVEKLDDLRRRERFKNVDLGPREERGDHFERRVFRCGADEGDVTRFDVGEKSVLLRFVEAMNFVDEDDGAAG